MQGIKIDAYSKILFKWMFTNRDRMPKGVRREEVGDNYDRDRGHMMEAKMRGSDTSNVGRIREGRVDTGTNTIKGLQGINTGVTLREFRKAGWGNVVSPHGFVQTPPPANGKPNPRMQKFVLALNLMRLEDCEPSLDQKDPWAMPRGSESGFDTLNNGSWTLNLWENPNGVITVNCVQFVPGNPGDMALTIRDGHLVAVSVDLL